MVKCLVFLLSSCSTELEKQRIAQQVFTGIPNHYSQLDEEFYNSLIPYLSQFYPQLNQTMVLMRQFLQQSLPICPS